MRIFILSFLENKNAPKLTDDLQPLALRDRVEERRLGRDLAPVATSAGQVHLAEGHLGGVRVLSLKHDEDLRERGFYSYEVIDALLQ